MYLLLFLLWLLLNGRVTPEIAVFGLIVAALSYVFAWKVLSFRASNDGIVLLNILLLALYLIVLLWEIARAAFSVMGLALSRKCRPDPVIFEFHSHLDGKFKNVLLANSITLTPGTYTLFQEGDRFVIHCLRKDYADGLTDSVFIKLLEKMRLPSWGRREEKP